VLSLLTGRRAAEAVLQIVLIVDCLVTTGPQRALHKMSDWPANPDGGEWFALGQAPRRFVAVVLVLANNQAPVGPDHPSMSAVATCRPGALLE